MTAYSSGFPANRSALLKKDSKKKKKKKKESTPAPSAKQVYETIDLRDDSFLRDPSDWEEASTELSFDDIRDLAYNAVKRKYTTSVERGYPSYPTTICRYYIHKIWPDKIVVKRSYENPSVSDPLFVLHHYTINGNEVELDAGQAVELGFIKSGSSADFMVAVRESDYACVDDPKLAALLEEEDLTVDEEVVEDDDFEEEEEDENESEEIDEDDDPDEDPDDDNDSDEDLEDEEVEEAALREAVDPTWFNEALDSVIDPGVTVIKEGRGGSHIIEGMALLSRVSKNKRKYPDEVQQRAIPLFEGAKAYCDHPAKMEEGEPRRVRDLIGVHRNVRFDAHAGKLRSDLHLSPTELVREYIIPHAQANPNIIGNSISASGKIASDGTVLEILKARSVDIVAEPATTSGIYESEGHPQTETKPKDSLGGEIMKFEDIIKDEALNKQLREHYREELEVEGSYEQLQEQLESLQEQVAEFKVKEAASALKAEVDSLLKECKLPEESKPELRPILEAAKDLDARKVIIARMEKIAESVKKTDGPAPSLQTTKDDGDGTQLTESQIVKSAVKAFGARRV